MPDLTAKRTLVKSPPELWSELSEVERLARHLGAFGEIKITKLEPEHTVAWEGEGASGTVSIEPSGWGTKVTLTAQLEGAAGESAVEDVTLEESPPLETAAGKEVEDEAGREAAEVAEPEAEEPPAVVEEPPAVVEEPPAVVEEPPAVVEEPPAVEPSPPEPVEPIGAQPRRKRGFLSWLFRQRTSVQVAAPPVPAPAEPVAEAPMLEEPPVADEPPVAEEPPVAHETLVAEEPWLAEEPPVADEPPVVDEPVAVEAPVSLHGSSAEAAAVDENRLDRDRAQAILDGALDALGSAHHRPFSRG